MGLEISKGWCIFASLIAPRLLTALDGGPSFAQAQLVGIRSDKNDVTGFRSFLSQVPHGPEPCVDALGSEVISLARSCDSEWVHVSSNRSALPQA